MTGLPCNDVHWELDFSTTQQLQMAYHDYPGAATAKRRCTTSNIPRWLLLGVSEGQCVPQHGALSI